MTSYRLSDMSEQLWTKMKMMGKKVSPYSANYSIYQPRIQEYCHVTLVSKFTFGLPITLPWCYHIALELSHCLGIITLEAEAIVSWKILIKYCILHEITMQPTLFHEQAITLSVVPNIKVLIYHVFIFMCTKGRHVTDTLHNGRLRSRPPSASLC